ncbi:hypothetical protein, partial [Paenibacillus sp. 2TAB19]|uniref:hypothetical protein n=1 Tax=Paenibacillus sp. 2TAB19 TaxID=3233003 RepID=UPI003F9CDAFA
VFWNYEVLSNLNNELSIAVLNIIQRQSRYAKLQGTQLSALIHTNNPNERITNLGSIEAEWNPAEWLNSRREM